MRHILIPLLFLPLPLAAETIEARSVPTAVTIYPSGASVTRTINFSAPAGEHEIVIADIPAAAPPESYRLTAAEGVEITGWRIATARPPVTADLAPPAVVEAREEVKRRAEALARTDDEIAALRARQEAAEAEIAFLGRVGGPVDTALTAEGVTALAGAIGKGVATARAAAIAAAAEVRAAEARQVDDRRALRRARQMLASIWPGAADHPVLTVAVRTAAEGAGALTLATIAGDATWTLAYDLRLAGKDAGSLTLDRSVLVRQATGEDWSDIDLSLSTADPGARLAPGDLWPELVRIGPAEEPLRAAADASFMTERAGSVPMMSEPAPVVVGETDFQDVVSYHYPQPVDLRSGADALRLGLDHKVLAASLRATAVPLDDEAVYLVATVTNDGGELILPGEAATYVAGGYRGTAAVPKIVPGGEAEIGLGVIEGITVKRTVPNRSEGDRGLITSRTQLDEQAVIEVRNLTGEDWPMRVIDRVPYSEQTDLAVTHEATPAETAADKDGRRGILIWDFDLAAGATQTITLDHSLRWPAGMVLWR